jgi:8-oxo-dGTP pyrophosphatase MutT (NUDIX family)
MPILQGEEYHGTAVRELQEEVSIPSDESHHLLQQLFIFPYQDSVCHVFGCAFRVVWDGPVQFADAEVDWGRFLSVWELQQQLQQEPERFTPVGRHILKLYLDWQQQQQQQQQGTQEQLLTAQNEPIHS